MITATESVSMCY